MRKKLLTLLIVLLVICSLAVVGVTFAYYRQYEAGWKQTISATSVVFKLNGKSVNTVTNYDLGLISRGKEAELDFEVSIKASASKNSVASFNLDISFDEQNADRNELARAIEVHEFVNGKYSYVGMLNEMDSITGTLTVNTEKNFYYKFVYSEAAADYFDGKSFSLILNASSGVNSGESDYYFASSYDGLMRAAEAGAALSGKTLILTNNVTVLSSSANGGVVNFDYPVSLDLNGKTLNLGDGTAINFTYTTAGKPSVINSNPAVNGVITGNGKVTYNCPTSAGQEDFVFVQDSLEASFGHIAVNNAKFSALSAEMQSQLDEVSTDVLVVGQDVDFTENLKYYFSADYNGGRLTLTPPKNGATDDESVVKKTDSSYTAYVVNPAYNEDLTRTHHINFALASDASSATLRGHLSVRGTDISAIAEFLLASVPDTVNGSIFLAGHDAESNSTVTWISSDGILSGDGVYLPDGYEGLDSWTDANVQLGVIVYCAGVSYSANKTVTVRVLSPKQRTDVIYGYQQIIVDELNSETDVFATFVNAEYAAKAGLTDIEVSITDAEQNKNDVGEDYLQILPGTSTDMTSKIKVLNKPSVGNSVLVDVTLKFVYADNNAAGETVYTYHTVQKTVTVVGFTDSADLSDPTSTLQQAFDTNAYINGTGYSFTVPGFTAQGANVDYFVAEQYGNYVYVQNGVYTPEATGSFALIAGNYVFFDSTYNLDAQTGEYVSALNGNYIYVGDAYVDISTQRANNNIYIREATVTVLPSKVPAVLETSAVITAKIWDTIENGSPAYIKDAEDNDLVYTFNLAVKGIYHNTESEIAEYNLYRTLLRFYDLNGNGWIEVSEAQSEWYDGNTNLLAAEPAQITVNVGDYSKAYRYIDLSNISLNSIKGIEYFYNSLGFNFGGNQIINLSALNSLYLLNYIDLSNNLVADITDLGYLDSLEFIDLSGNPLTSIQPIRYLPAVSYLDLNSCGNIATYEYVQGYTNLHYLDIRLEGNPAISDETAYYMSLVYDSNRANSIVMHCSAETTWVPTDAQIVAAKVLNEMVCVREVYTTLNLPNYYYYEYTVGSTLIKNTYNVQWATDANEHNLTFTSENGKTTGYTISTPIVDKNVTVFVTVTDTSDVTSAVKVARTFRLTLLQSQAATDIAYVETAGGVQLASEVVPDTNLLNVLFGIFNTTTSGSVNVGGTSYNEKFILTQAELSILTSTNHDDSFVSAGISSLTGLRHFANCIGFDLDLRGNVIENQSIGELSYMTNVRVIKLNGANYDFSLISSYTDGAANPVSGLTDLTALYVYGCLELDGDEALNRLYQVYLANPSVNIYKDGDTTVWNPYEILPKYAQSLPSAFVFINLNDEKSFYAEGENSQTYNFYGVKDVVFTLSMTDDNLSGYFKGNFDHTATGIKYKTLAGYSDTVYDKTVLTGNDGSGRADITANHYIELKIEFNYRILVTDYPLQSGNVGLDTIFPGRDLRAKVISKLSELFSGNSNVGYTVDGDYYYISMSTIAALDFGDDIISVDGTFSDSGENVIQGLQYTSIKKLKIERDANVGDGTYLTGINTLIISYSGVDLSGITVNLPALEYLWIGSADGSGDELEPNRYTVLYDNSGSEPYYNLARMTNLKEFVLLDSNCYNWLGLNGLIGINLSKLYIYSGADSYANKNGNASSTEAIVRQIYNQSTAPTKDFRIGTISSASSTTQYTGTGWGTSESGLTEIKQEPVKEYNDFAPLLHDLGVKLNGTYSLTADALISNGGTITLPSSTFGFYGTTNGDANDFTRRFAIQWKIYGVNATEAAQLFGLNGLTGGTANGMSYVNVPNGASGLSDVVLTVNSYAYDFYFVIVGTIGSNYVTSDAVNHSNGGYFDESGAFVGFASAVTAYSFGYPVLVNGTAAQTTVSVNIAYSNSANGAQAGTVTVSGDNFYQLESGGKTLTYLSYKAITDPGLRFRLFASIASLTSISAGKNYEKNGLIFYSSSDNYLGAAKLSSLSGTTAVNTINYYGGNSSQVTLSVFGKNMSGVYIDSLDGLNYFIGLNEIILQNNDVRNISALSGLSAASGKHLIYDGSNTGFAGLTVLNLKNNNVRDLSPLAGLSALTAVNLSENPVDGLTYLDNGNSTYVFTSSVGVMTTLDLTSCKNVTAADLTAMATTYTAGSGRPLSSLSVYDTSAVYDAAALVAIGNIASSTSDALYVSYSAASQSVFTKTEVDTLFADVAASETMNAYVNTGYALYFTFATQITVSGRTYSLSLLSADYILNAENKGNTSYLDRMGTSSATLRISTGAQYAVDYVIDVYDNTSGVIGINQSAPIAIYNNTDAFVYSDSFDPALWQYLINHSTLKSLGNVSYFDYSPSDDGKTTLTLPGNVGMRSLKGIQLLTSLANLTVGSTSVHNSTLTELWDGEFTSLTSFALINSAVKENALSALRYTPNLTTLKLSQTEGIDYLNSFSYTLNSTTYTSTAADIILDYCDALTALYVNTDATEYCYNGVNAFAEYASTIDVNSYLFGISPSDNANARRLSTFSKGVSVNTSSVIAAGTVRNHKLSDFDTYNTATVNALYLNGKTAIRSSNGSEISLDITTAVQYSSLLATAAGRDILPTRIYQSDVEDTGVLYYLPDTLRVNGTTLTYTWSISSAVSAYLQNNVFYVNSTNFDETNLSFTLSYALKNGNKTVSTGEREITVVTSEVSVTPSTNKLPVYYVEVPGESGNTVLRPASDYFKSSRLLYWLFNSKFSSSLSRITLNNYQMLDVPASAIGSYYLSMQTINETTALNIPNEGVTTLKGVELFANLTSFKIVGGAIISIDELANMSLIDFEYQNSSSDTRNFLLSDFTPLFNSKDTLISFRYHTGGYIVNLDDLAFLKEFGEQLTTITIGTGNNNKVEGYNHTLSFKYLVAWFAANRPATTIIYNNVNETAGATDSDWQRAAEMFDRVDFSGTGLSVKSESRLIFSANASVSPADATSATVTAQLPTSINHGGIYYPLYWNTLSAFVSFSSLTYNGSAFSFTFEGDATQTAIADGAALTEEQYAELLNDRTFLQRLVSGDAEVTQTMTLRDKTNNLSCFAYLLARISIDGFEYERSYIIDFCSNPDYLQILLKTGVGHVYLSDNYGSAACEWFIKGADGNPVDFNRSGIAEYDGIALRKLNYVTGTEQSLMRTVLVVTDPTQALSGEVTLYCKVGAVYHEYTLYHSFTSDAKNAAVNAVTPTVAQRDYLIALRTVDFDTLIEEMIGSLTGVYAGYTMLYESGNYSAAGYATITAAYNTAVASINSETDLDNARDQYNAAIVAMSEVVKQYRIFYNKSADGSGEAFADSIMRSVGQSVVLPADGDYTFTDENGAAIICWIVNGILYEFGESFVMPESDVIVAPIHLSSTDYYLTKSGEEANYLTSGYLMTLGSKTIGATSYEYYVDHLIINDKWLNDNKAFSVIEVPTVGDYSIVGTYTIQSEIINMKVRPDGSENIQTGIGEYAFYFDLDSAQPSAALTAERSPYFFTLSVSASSMADSGEGYSTTIQWKKPDLNFVLNYDRDYDVYYITFTTAGTTPKLKVCGAMPANLNTSASNIGTQFYLSDGYGTTSDIGLNKNVTYTLYFTPDASVFNNSSVANYGGNAVGFTNTLVDDVKYASSGIVIIKGDYQTTRALVTVNHNANA